MKSRPLPLINDPVELREVFYPDTLDRSDRCALRPIGLGCCAEQPGPLGWKATGGSDSGVIWGSLQWDMCQRLPFNSLYCNVFFLWLMIGTQQGKGMAATEMSLSQPFPESGWSFAATYGPANEHLEGVFHL